MFIFTVINGLFSFSGLILEFKITQKCEAFYGFKNNRVDFTKKLSLLCLSGKKKHSEATYFRFLDHLSNSGDHLIWVGVRRASCVYIFFSRTT